MGNINSIVKKAIEANNEQMNGDYKEAIKKCSYIIGIDPKNGFAFFLRAVCYFRIGKITKAYDDTKQALQLGLSSCYSNNNDNIYPNLASAIFYSNNCKEAQKHLNKIKIRLDRGVIQGIIYYYDTKFSLATKLYEKELQQLCDDKCSTYVSDRALTLGRVCALISASSNSKVHAIQALEYFQIVKNTSFFEICFYKGIAYTTLKKYDLAISNFDQAIRSADCTIGWLHHKRARAYFLNKNYAKALRDFIQAIVVHPELKLVIREFKQAIKDLIKAGDFKVLIKFRDKYRSNITILHFVVSNKYDSTLRLLVENITARDFFLARDNKQNTALMLAQQQGNESYTKLLLEPVLKHKMQQKFLTISNSDFKEELKRKRDEKYVYKQVKRIKQTPLEIALSYLECGLTEDNQYLVSEIFQKEKFAALSKKYEQEIRTTLNKQAEQKLKEEITKINIAKLRFDSEQLDSNLELYGKCESTDNAIIKFLEDILTKICSEKTLSAFRPYIEEMKHLFKALVDAADYERDFLETLHIIFKNYSGKYGEVMFSLLEHCLLLNDQCQSSFKNIFPIIVKIVNFFVRIYGDEKSKDLASRFTELLNDFVIHNEDEFIKLENIAAFSSSNETIKAVKIIGSLKIISDEFAIMKQHLKYSQAQKAKQRLCSLVYNIIITADIYPENINLVESITRVVANYKITNISNYVEYQQYIPIVDLFRKINSIHPNKSFAKMITTLENFIKDASKHSNKFANKLLILARFFSRLLIEFGKQTKTELFSIAGVLSLMGINLISATKNMLPEKTITGKLGQILLTTDEFLHELAFAYKQPVIFRIQTGVIITSMVIKITDTLIKSDNKNLDLALKVISSNAGQTHVRIEKILEDSSQDKAVKIVRECFDILKIILFGSKAVKFGYDLINTVISKTLHANLEKIIPESVLSAITGTLQGIPVVGNVLSAWNIHNEMNKLKDSILDRVEKSTQNLSNQITKLGNQIGRVENALSSFKPNFIKIIAQLKDIQEMLKDQKRLIINSTLLAKIGEFTNRLDCDFKVTKSNQSKISDIKDISERCNKFRRYLLPKLTDKYQCIASIVYNEDLSDFFTLLQKILLSKFTVTNSILVYPNLELWIYLSNYFVRYLTSCKPVALFEADKDILYFIYQMVKRSVAVVNFLNYLLTEQCLRYLLDKVVTENVALSDLQNLALYCTLVGVPLTVYGADLIKWTEESKKGLVWRRSIRDTILRLLPEKQTNNILKDLRITILNIIYLKSNLLHSLANSYLNKVDANSNKTIKKTKKLLASIGNSSARQDKYSNAQFFTKPINNNKQESKSTNSKSLQIVEA